MWLANLSPTTAAEDKRRRRTSPHAALLRLNATALHGMLEPASLVVVFFRMLYSAWHCRCVASYVFKLCQASIRVGLGSIQWLVTRTLLSLLSSTSHSTIVMVLISRSVLHPYDACLSRKSAEASMLFTSIAEIMQEHSATLSQSISQGYIRTVGEK
jgi:general stress protein CsbA